MINLDLVRSSLSSIAGNRRANHVFGASSHGFMLNPRATTEELASIEARLSCVLPPAYRSFLIEAGNGGAGPGYGLWPAGLWDPTNRHLEPIEPPQWPDAPGEPFPHTEHWNVPDDRLGPAPGPEATDAGRDRYYYQRDEATWAAGVANGALPIADLGCAIRLLLIVTGEEHNHVWIDDRASDGGIYPASTPGHDRLTFTDLYEDWLDQSMLFCDSGQRTNRLW